MARLVRRRTGFAGDRSAVAFATFAQQEMWELMRARGPDAGFHNLTRGLTLPAGHTVEDVLDRLAELLNRHESLRTLFRLGSDGVLRQRILGSGEFTVDILLTTTAEDPDPRALGLRYEKRLHERAFDLAEELPFRPLIEVTDGIPRAVTICVPHVVADLTGLRTAVEELAWSLGASAAERAARPAPPQQVEQAEQERSPAARRALARALRYLHEEFATRPRRMFEPAPGPPSYFSGVLESRAAALALNVLAIRHRVSTSVVLLAATAAVLGARTGRSACALQLVAGNRFTATSRAAVANLIQEVPVTIRLDGRGFDDLVRATWAATMRAYRHSRFPPDRCAELRAEAEMARGTPVHLCCFFNDARTTVRAVQTPDGPGSLRAALAETTFHPADYRERHTFSLFVLDGPGTIRLVLAADTRALPPPEVERYLRTVEGLLVELAVEDRAVAAVLERLDAAELPSSGRLGDAPRFVLGPS
ncbi:condensation domain-containing protein [Amycolatopsis anabasis]|uniref:condensation domain-containing protein n=1 Tax=Amycolatopsis anabasis TaxID=1840409 RepID=UPI00131D1523|nr:condensation domain-containing protein [Amycolatopsis anabasis]